MPDEIITELWQIKDAIAREHGYDVRALVARLEGRKRGEGERVVDLHRIKQSGQPMPPVGHDAS